MSSNTLTLRQLSIGKKTIMAISGVILLVWITMHMAGNLQIYLGPETINGYAAWLHSKPALLWVGRIALAFSVLAHIVSAAQLFLQNRRARPVRYVKKAHTAATYASRTMYLSGPIIALFVIYHLLHLTAGKVHAFEEGNVYCNVVNGFGLWYVALTYIVANAILGTHLIHGVWSLFQTIGLNCAVWNRRIRILATLVTSLIVVGNISIPVSVLLNIIPRGVCQ